MLREPVAVRRLRDAGWSLPAEVSDEVILQVYDTRLDPEWARSVATEVGMGLPSSLVGGDFLTSPVVDDKAALHPTRLTRWGPPGSDPHHLFVAPRPHQA